MSTSDSGEYLELSVDPVFGVGHACYHSLLKY